MSVTEISKNLEKELPGERESAKEIDIEEKDTESNAKAMEDVHKQRTEENKVCGAAGMSREETSKLNALTKSDRSEMASLIHRMYIN